MKKTFTILALTASIFAIIFSVLPVSNLAVFPAITALLCGAAAFYLSKKSGNVKKIIPFTFLLTTMSLAITAYKAIFIKTEVASTEVLEATETKLEEEAIEELDNIEIDEIEIDDSDIENISIDE